MREFDITYFTKEKLIEEGWQIVAYNPPGSQGTFTIPNPSKDGSYRGQTGSMSPDIVGLKIENNKNIIIVVECKPIYNESDVLKLKSMLSNPLRNEIFLKIIEKQSKANRLIFNGKYPSLFITAKAHGGEKRLVNGLRTYHVMVDYSNWDPNHFKAKLNIKKYCTVSSF